jgi:hypothetical protein
MEHRRTGITVRSECRADCAGLTDRVSARNCLFYWTCSHTLWGVKVNSMGRESKTVQFHYIKGNFFRVVHVDGIFGGLSPTGDIFASFFSQRPPIPRLTVQSVNEKGELGEELLPESEIRDGLVREIEVGVVMRPEVAENLIKWLQTQVDSYKKLTDRTAMEQSEKNA